MGDMELQKFNAGASRMPKRQERALGSWKGDYADRGDMWQEEDNDGNIEILLFFLGAKEENSERLLQGWQTQRGVLGQEPYLRTFNSPRTGRR